MVKRIWIVGLFLFATSANAIPVHFDVDGQASSVSTSGFSLCLGCNVAVALNPYLDSQVFDLDVGQSATFDLFSISAHGIVGAVVGTVRANLAFALPSPSTSTGTAAAAAAWGFGFGSGGLTFGVLGQPSDTLFGNGGRFSVSFSNAFDTCRGGWSGCTLTDTVTATVTLLSSAASATSVPEPTAVSLLGLGLIGLAMIRRRVRHKN